MLLILAMVSISLVINSGIINKAKYGVDKYSEEEELEQIKLAVASAQLKGNGFLTADNLNTELQTRFNNEDEVIETSKYWNYKGYKISKDNNIEDNLLPDEYQQVEYIENTAMQYIDTLFKGNQDTKIVCEAAITDTFKQGYYQGLFGATDSVGTKELNRNVVHMHRLSATQLIVMATYGDKVQTTGFNGDITQKHIYELNKNIYKVDDNVIYTYPKLTFECTKNMNIFRDENNVNSTQNKRYCLMKLFSLKIYDNEKIVRNFVPCYSATTVTDVDGISRPKDTIGMYDTVEGKFYVNKGSGTFLKGNDV